MLLASAALIGVAGSQPGVAADLPYKAPISAVANYNWNGFYVGGNAGVA
jgi:hypothetical protein